MARVFRMLYVAWLKRRESPSLPVQVRGRFQPSRECTLPVGVVRVPAHKDDALTEVANYGLHTLGSPTLPGFTASLAPVFGRPSFTA